MNPELAVEGASFLDQLVAVAKAGTRYVGIVANTEEFAVGIVYDQPLLVVPSRYDNVPRAGKHPVKDARVPAVD